MKKLIMLTLSLVAIFANCFAFDYYDRELARRKLAQRQDEYVRFQQAKLRQIQAQRELNAPETEDDLDIEISEYKPKKKRRFKFW